MNTIDTIRFDYWNGGGGIRTHGTLADTLVFKGRGTKVIAIDLIGLDETKRQKLTTLILIIPFILKIKKNRKK